MAVSVIVNNPLTLVHKISSGISMATIPDVCKTPTPAGPVPVPYPNISMASDLMKGPKSIKAEGVMPANYGSEFMKSTGDEPGTAGGVVSSTFIKESTWMTFSFDVKLEGKGAARMSDKKFHNHMNTVNAGGELQVVQVLNEIKDLIAEDVDNGCEKLRDFMDDVMGKGKTGKTSNGIRGLEERRHQQKYGGNLGRRGAPDAPSDRPGLPNAWHRHNYAIEIQQDALKKAFELYNDKCKDGPPPPPGVEQEYEKPLPDPSHYQAEWWGARPSAEKVALVLGAGLLAIGAAALLLVPFDGPFGEAALGSASAATWAAAMAIP